MRLCGRMRACACVPASASVPRPRDATDNLLRRSSRVGASSPPPPLLQPDCPTRCSLPGEGTLNEHLNRKEFKMAEYPLCVSFDGEMILFNFFSFFLEVIHIIFKIISTVITLFVSVFSPF